MTHSTYLFPALYKDMLVWYKADFAWFHKACGYAMQNETGLATESLQRAIELDANRCEKPQERHQPWLNFIRINNFSS